MRKKAVELGVEMLERIMITSLIKPKNKIEGAIGFHTETGDSLSSMQNGAGYTGFGCSCAGSCVQGSRAGIAVVEAIKNIDAPAVDLAYLENLQEEMLQPYYNKKGFSPAWVVQLMQNIMFHTLLCITKKKQD